MRKKKKKIDPAKSLECGQTLELGGKAETCVHIELMEKGVTIFQTLWP